MSIVRSKNARVCSHELERIVGEQRFVLLFARVKGLLVGERWRDERGCFFSALEIRNKYYVTHREVC